MSVSKTETEFTVAALANVIRNDRLCADDLARRRRALCMACPEHVVEDGRLRCRLCGCHDPARTRPRCPVFKW